MGQTGIARIDGLWLGNGAGPVARGDADAEAVGAIQDLLNAHGADLPGPLGSAHGSFGSQTEEAVVAFQTKHGLAPTGTIESETLHRLVESAAPSPIASRPYLTLGLDLPWSGFTRLVSLTSQFEGGGKFSARNKNKDGAGLSFGLIQWAQKPGRLAGIVRSFQKASSERFVAIFGAGDPAVANGLLAHLTKPNGGVDPSGKSTDPAFDLLTDPWFSRFGDAARAPVFQKAQVDAAIGAFRDSAAAVRAAVPLARSERAMAFLLDVANQHGDGGMRSICQKAFQPGMTEKELLEAAANESIGRVTAQFANNRDIQESAVSRRTAFRTSPLLSDAPFQEI